MSQCCVFFSYCGDGSRRPSCVCVLVCASLSVCVCVVMHAAPRPGYGLRSSTLPANTNGHAQAPARVDERLRSSNSYTILLPAKVIRGLQYFEHRNCLSASAADQDAVLTQIAAKTDGRLDKMVSSLRQAPRPGYGLAARSHTFSSSTGGDFTFSGMGDKTHSTDFSSGKSDSEYTLLGAVLARWRSRRLQSTHIGAVVESAASKVWLVWPRLVRMFANKRLSVVRSPDSGQPRLSQYLSPVL
ncbi:hypothetical protein MSG28_014370 [Choristoneura fumiferana]|uniref:Uncharacterized protein n=1 Tax=Choristoneura fumiferana TaxID=7141 RepID=A0ACC0JH03_CHOFU|nr:hypothetical protein MSG28_014370 [Choristoneura fumiferana]